LKGTNLFNRGVLFLEWRLGGTQLYVCDFYLDVRCDQILSSLFWIIVILEGIWELLIVLYFHIQKWQVLKVSVWLMMGF